MAAMPLPLQLKSWKGCIAELIAQPNFRLSLLRHNRFLGGKRSMGLTILMSRDNSVYHLHAHRASFLLHLQISVATVMICALAQLDVFLCRRILFDLAGCDLAYIGLWQLGCYGLAGSA